MGDTTKYTLAAKCVFVIAGMMALGLEPTCENLRQLFDGGLVPDDVYKEVGEVCFNNPVEWGIAIQKARYWVCVGSCK